MHDQLDDRECRACGGERPFEVPPCADGHGDGCPERVCTGCGTALVVGGSPPSGLRAPAPRAAGPRRLAVVA